MLEMTVRELLTVLDREQLTQAAVDDLDHTLYDAGLTATPTLNDLDLNGSVRLTRREVIPAELARPMTERDARERCNALALSGQVQMYPRGRAPKTPRPTCSRRWTVPTPAAVTYPGAIPRYGSANPMICPNAGAATVPP
jgi:hypothetical protein